MHVIFRKIKKTISFKSERGASLVEVMVAFFIIAIIATLVIQTTKASLRALEINKTKTVAISIANEEIEKIRAMEYEDIGISGNDPDGILSSYTVNSDGYTIYYDISWVNGTDSYKQVQVRVSKDNIPEDIEVITQISPDIGT